MKRRTKVTISCIFLAGFAILTLYSLVWVPLQRHLRLMDVSINCSNNLRAIGQALQRYQVAYGVWLGGDSQWEDRLIASGLVDKRYLVCPVRLDKRFRYHLESLHADGAKLSGNEILVYEDLDAHWGESACLLFADGHADCVKPERLRAELERTGINRNNR